jgi:hypothetical protein
MKKSLLIVGAGGFGREVLGWAAENVSVGIDWCIGGVLDSNPRSLDQFRLSYTILGDPQTYQPTENDVFVCAIGDPATRLRVCSDLRARGARFANIIHRTAIVGSDVQMGQGVILCPYSVVTTNVILLHFMKSGVKLSGKLQEQVVEGANS